MPESDYQRGFAEGVDVATARIAEHLEATAENLLRWAADNVVSDLTKSADQSRADALQAAAKKIRDGAGGGE